MTTTDRSNTGLNESSVSELKDEKSVMSELNLELKRLFRNAPTLANAQLVLKRIAQTGRQMTPVRLAVLRSFTIEPVLPLLQASAALYGVDITSHVGEFNTIAQEILDPNSALYRFDPRIVILATQTRDLLPDIWNRFAHLTKEEADEIVRLALENVRQWLQLFRSRSQASVIIHNLEVPGATRQGILDSQLAHSQKATIIRFNQELQTIAREITGVYLLDYDGLVSRFGSNNWHDERKWLTMRMPIVANHLNDLADEYLRFVLPLTGKVCKALVLDLDNTLWGGVIGEDGMQGIRLSSEHPGAYFQEVQKVALDLYQRGIILAVASKNNLADAMEALESHPGMVLKPAHFAALRINWNDKAQNLREIAAELNIGIDSLAFLDDNPAERTRIQQEVPEITVIDLPEDPAGYARALRECPVFERLTLSAEDRERGRMYAEQRQRTELQQSAGSLEEYYRSLKQVMEIGRVTPMNLARVAQLTQKTNQFNLTTRRYSEPEIEELERQPGSRVYTMSVLDCFGDNGLVGIAIVKKVGDAWEIDTLLMSCRVIGRTVETAFLAYLGTEAQKDGARYLQGWFLPTKKNAPAQDFYPSHHFTRIEENAQGSLWQYDLSENPLSIPDWIECRLV